MKDHNTEQRRARIGELQEELKPQVPMRWMTQTIFAVTCALIGVVAFLLACWFFGIAQIIIN